MLPLVVVVCVVLWSGPVVAIKWDFDDGTTYFRGWSKTVCGGLRSIPMSPKAIITRRVSPWFLRPN